MEVVGAEVGWGLAGLGPADTKSFTNKAFASVLRATQCILYVKSDQLTLCGTSCKFALSSGC